MIVLTLARGDTWARRQATDQVVSKGTVLPVALTTDLSSVTAHPGDMFTARLLTHGTERYAGLPFGTVVYGSIKFVKRLAGASAGILELEFTGVETPSGHRFPISGQLRSLEDKNLKRGKDGLLMDVTSQFSRVVFAGYGKQPHLVVGIPFSRPIKDLELAKVMERSISPATRKGPADEVQLPSDSEFGVKLLRPLELPKDVM